ncbi:MAG: L,D-transpeptidase [Paracoccaceae bacterium]
MSKVTLPSMNRRMFLASAAASGLAAPALAQDLQDLDASTQDTGSIQMEADISSSVRRNISSFRTLNWEPYFGSLKNGAVLVDTTSRALHYWSEDGQTYILYPTSVPISENLTKRGRTSIVRMVVGPSWSPTPNMRKRNPEWPAFVPPGPDNPLGTHALYLSWKYYRIHGTHDTRKIGRRSSNGCIGLFNQHIEQLYGHVKVGTQVLLI